MTQREADWAEDIAYEIAQEYAHPPVGAYYTDAALQRMIERALRRVREEAIEEVAALFPEVTPNNRAIVERIRALKEKP